MFKHFKILPTYLTHELIRIVGKRMINLFINQLTILCCVRDILIKTKYIFRSYIRDLTNILSYIGSGGARYFLLVGGRAITDQIFIWWVIYVWLLNHPLICLYHIFKKVLLKIFWI